MALTGAVRERLHGRDSGIGAKDAGQGVQEDAFAVPAGAVGEEQGVLLDITGEAVAGHPLQEGLQVRVAAGDPGEEGVPLWAISAGRRGRNLGDVVGRLMRAHPAGPEVHGAARRVQQPGVGIPLLHLGGVTPIGAGEALNGTDGFGAGDLLGDAILITG